MTPEAQIVAAVDNGNGDATVPGVHTRGSVVAVLFQVIMDGNGLDYELAGCPVACSAAASGGINGRTPDFQL